MNCGHCSGLNGHTGSGLVFPEGGAQKCGSDRGGDGAGVHLFRFEAVVPNLADDNT